MIQANHGAGAVVNRNLSSAAAPMETVAAGGERILVIEDDRAVQKALKRLFEGEGFAVDIAGNGAAGLEMFRAAAPSVLVLDLSLPGTPGGGAGREGAKNNQPGGPFAPDHHSQCANGSDGQGAVAGVGCT